MAATVCSVNFPEGGAENFSELLVNTFDTEHSDHVTSRAAFSTVQLRGQQGINFDSTCDLFRMMMMMIIMTVIIGYYLLKC